MVFLNFAEESKGWTSGVSSIWDIGRLLYIFYIDEHPHRFHLTLMSVERKYIEAFCFLLSFLFHIRGDFGLYIRYLYVYRFKCKDIYKGKKYSSATLATVLAPGNQ